MPQRNPVYGKTPISNGRRLGLLSLQDLLRFGVDPRIAGINQRIKQRVARVQERTQTIMQRKSAPRPIGHHGSRKG